MHQRSYGKMKNKFRNILKLLRTKGIIIFEPHTLAAPSNNTIQVFAPVRAIDLKADILNRNRSLRISIVILLLQ